MRGGPALVIVAVLATVAVAANQQEEKIVLIVGQQRVVRVEVDPDHKVYLGDPKVADIDITAENDAIRFVGTGPGTTDVTFTDAEGRKRTIKVNVLQQDPEKVAAEIRAILGEVEGIEVKVVGERVVIDGTLLTVKDRDRVAVVHESYPQVLNLSRLDLSTHNSIIAAELKEKIGFPEVEVSVAGDKVILRGTVYREKDREMAEKVAEAYFENVTNLLSVEERMIEIDLLFVKVNRADGVDFGMNVLDTVAVDATGSGQGGSIDMSYGVSARAAARLNMAVSRGDATIITRPHLTTTNGKPGSFHQGGEKGYKVATEAATGVEFKKYGLLLDVTPEMTADGSIATSFSIEVSAPAGELDFTTFSSSAKVLCRPGESIVVSGLIDSIRNTFRDRTPILGEIPVLNAFFGRRGDDRTETDLVLILMPRLPSAEAAIEPAYSEAHAEALREAAADPIAPEVPEPAEDRSEHVPYWRRIFKKEKPD